MGWLDHALQHLLSSWGYWAVCIALFGENAGLPLPGESTLMLASFYAHKHSGLHIQWIVLAGIATCILGDNLGYFVGHRYGDRLIQWAEKHLPIDEQDVKAGRDLIKRHGGMAVFSARFIFGLRTIFGPLAGSLGMDWRRFLKYNVLGAIAWVCTMAFVGYGIANAFQSMLGYLEKASWAIAGGIFLAGYLFWRHYKHSRARAS